MEIYNRLQLKQFRRDLRKRQTVHEKILWNELRGKKLSGYKFFRQYSVDNYILDFYCPKARLAIELDGSHHAETDVSEYDRIRTIHIESYNIKVLRFWNIQIIEDLKSVLNTILLTLE